MDVLTLTLARLLSLTPIVFLPLELGSYSLGGWTTTYSAWRFMTSGLSLQSIREFLYSEPCQHPAVQDFYYLSTYVRKSTSICFMLTTC